MSVRTHDQRKTCIEHPSVYLMIGLKVTRLLMIPSTTLISIKREISGSGFPSAGLISSNPFLKLIPF